MIYRTHTNPDNQFQAKVRRWHEQSVKSYRRFRNYHRCHSANKYYQLVCSNQTNTDAEGEE
jgi:hypothetical protein